MAYRLHIESNQIIVYCKSNHCLLYVPFFGKHFCFCIDFMEWTKTEISAFLLFWEAFLLLYWFHGMDENWNFCLCIDFMEWMKTELNGNQMEIKWTKCWRLENVWKMANLGQLGNAWEWPTWEWLEVESWILLLTAMAKVKIQLSSFASWWQKKRRRRLVLCEIKVQILDNGYYCCDRCNKLSLFILRKKLIASLSWTLHHGSQVKDGSLI